MQNQETEQQCYPHMEFVPPQHRYLQLEPFSSAFFTDHCEEQYQIQRAFRADNFTNLRSKIPNQLKFGAILQERLQKVQSSADEQAVSRARTGLQKQQQRKSKIQRKKMQQIGQLGYFQIFPYQQSLYNIQHELQREQYSISKRKQQKISQLDFRPAGFDRKLKSQDPFAYIQKLEGPRTDKNQYLFPFHIPQDTYDRFHESELRQKIIKKNDKLAGQFIPATNDRSLTKISKSRAAEIIKELEVFLKKYLPTVGFFIGMSKKDHIDVLFEEGQADNTKLQILMSKLCENENLSKYLLRRHPEKWDRVGESGYLEYCLLPPWVKDPDEKLTSN